MFIPHGKRAPLYGSALISAIPSAAYDRNSSSFKLVHVLSDSGASGHYFDDSLIPELNRRLLDCTYLATPRKNFSARRTLLDDTGEGVLQGIITDNYGNGHIVWIQILVVPTIGRDLFLVTKAMGKGVVSILDHENSRLESFRATLSLRQEYDDLYLFTLGLSVGGYGPTELAMNIAFKVRI